MALSEPLIEFVDREPDPGHAGEGTGNILAAWEGRRIADHLEHEPVSVFDPLNCMGWTGADAAGARNQS